MTGCSNTGGSHSPKTADYSRVTMSHMMLPQDANPVGIVHGGVVMKHIDDAAGVVALRHTRCNVVTASIDRLDFHNPGLYRQPAHLQGQPEPGGYDLHGSGRARGDRRFANR